MRKSLLLVVISVLLLTSCSTTGNMPKTTINGATVGGGSGYCVSLSALVGALVGGFMGTFLASGQGQQGTAAVGWGTASTAGGAFAGAMAGYLACAPSTTSTAASEPKSL